MRALIAAMACGLLTISVPATASGALLESINAVRAAGCGGERGVATPLRANRKLDAVAKRLSRGAQLKSALADSDYRALHSASMFLSGAQGNAEIANTLAHRACGELRNAEVREIGIEKRGNSVWLVFAAPFEADALKDTGDVNNRILQLANQARSRARRCGSQKFSSAPPLGLNKKLTEAAQAHARDMAKHNMLEHIGSNGSTPATRITKTGYSWRTVGENIASGPTTPEEVMEGWLASPGHCENLMSPNFSEMGIAWVVDANSASGVYWAQTFGARKDAPPIQ